MQVKSIAECFKGGILQYLWPSLSYHLSLGSLYCLFLSGHFTQVLLYSINLDKPSSGAPGLKKWLHIDWFLGILLFSRISLNPFHFGYMQTGTLANTEDPDDKVAFHQGLHCLERQKQILMKATFSLAGCRRLSCFLLFWQILHIFFLNHHTLCLLLSRISASYFKS